MTSPATTAGTPEQPEPDSVPSPGRPSETPPETPSPGPDIDVPAPSTPGTEAPATPISPIA